MERQDRDAIETLFGKLADVERQGMPRDPEAEAYIRDRIASQPGAAYYMAQTIVMQEQALNAAQARVDAGEGQENEPERAGGGGFFDNLFGGGDKPRRATVPAVGGRIVPNFRRPDTAQSPFGRDGAQPQAPAYAGRGGGFGGGGFLAGAAQTAMGVAGGVLLGNAIAGMFNGPEGGSAGEADQAADAGGETGAEAQDASFDEGGGDFGGDFGDMDI